MKGKRKLRLWICMFLTLLFSVFLSLSVCSGAQKAKPDAQKVKPVFQKVKPVSSSLGNEDCIKCHAGPPAAISANGAKHKMVNCQDCHIGHPPAVAAKSIIPKCNQCHDGKPHYSLKGCSPCHINTHTPLNIKIGKNMTDECLTCHSQQIKQLRENKTKHTSLYCSNCHQTRHRMIPQCQSCHGDKHPAGIKFKFKNCGDCHKTAHDLNNWKAQGTTTTPNKAIKKEFKKN